MTPEQVKNIFSGTYSRLLILLVIALLVGVGVASAHRLQDDTKSSKATAQKVNIWKKQYGYLVTALTKDFSQAETDSSADKVTALESDCTNIRQDAITATQKPAIPDATAQAAWHQALNADSAGGNNCINGIESDSSSLMKQASQDFTDGSTYLTTVAKALQKLQQ